MQHAELEHRNNQRAILYILLSVHKWNGAAALKHSCWPTGVGWYPHLFGETHLLSSKVEGNHGFDDGAMAREMLAGYSRESKFLYRDLRSNPEVQRRIYFFIDSRKYLEALFGLMNPAAERFCVAAIERYGHKNHSLPRIFDSETGFCMQFDFARIDRFSFKHWPRFHLPDVNGQDLALFVAGLYPSVYTLI